MKRPVRYDVETRDDEKLDTFKRERESRFRVVCRRITVATGFLLFRRIVRDMADRGRKRWTTSEGGTRSGAKKQGLREREREREKQGMKKTSLPGRIHLEPVVTSA